jgi:hypothetical protein
MQTEDVVLVYIVDLMSIKIKTSFHFGAVGGGVFFGAIFCRICTAVSPGTIGLPAIFGTICGCEEYII